MTEAMDLAILAGAGLVSLSIITSLLSFRIGAPLLLVFLAVGLLAGENGPGGIHFSDVRAAYFIGSLSLAIILFDSGFETRLQSYRIAAAPALTLATLGVVITAGLVGWAAHMLLGLPWVEGLLVGAIAASTDAAAVFFLLRVGGVVLRDRVKATLEIESGTNDPMAIFLTITLVELAAGAHRSGSGISWTLASAFVAEMGIGLIAGIIGGLLVGAAIRRLSLEPALQPIAALSLALVLFAATALVGGSGFLAVYLAGLVAGNMGLKAAPRLRRFQSGMTWLAQMGMFLTLGLLATPAQFASVAAPALALAFLLMFVARPVAAWVCLAPFGFSRNEVAFVAWVGLRGAVSILLAILPSLGGLPNAGLFFNVVFVMVLASLVLQGWTVGTAARWLGMVVPPRRGPVERVDLELPDDADQELVAYRVHRDSAVVKGERMPRWARPALIIRAGHAFTLHTAGPLQPDDHVYLFTAPQRLHLLDRLFAGRAGIEDREFYGDFSLPASARLGDVAQLYGFEVPEDKAALRVGELLTREYGGRAETGDRLTVGPVELIVRALDEDGRVQEVGLAVEPTQPAQPRLPFFQGRRGIRAWLERLRPSRSGDPGGPPDQG